MTGAFALVVGVMMFALGAVVGSFLNVVIHRLPLGKSLVYPPSHCPFCETPIPWYDNIPILSWMLLRGRCRFCRKPISVRYLIVEILTAVLFVVVFWGSFQPGKDFPHLWGKEPLGIWGWLAVPDYRPETSPPSWAAVIRRTLAYLLLLTTLLAATVIAWEGKKVPLRLFLPLYAAGIILWLALPWLPAFGLFGVPDPIESIFWGASSLVAGGLIVFLGAWFWNPELRPGFTPAMFSASLLVGPQRALVAGSGALLAFVISRILVGILPALGRVPFVGWLFLAFVIISIFW
jgi:prepilin signal peptidase PulO-like enzyme (type II secretory pathway)